MSNDNLVIKKWIVGTKYGWISCQNSLSMIIIFHFEDKTKSDASDLKLSNENKLNSHATKEYMSRGLKKCHFRKNVRISIIHAKRELCRLKYL